MNIVLKRLLLWSVVTTSLLLAHLGCSSFADSQAVLRGDLEIDLTLSEENLVAEITVHNKGAKPLAVANFYGSHARWIRLEVSSQMEDSGRDFWPELHLDFIPPYDCLRPGESFRLKVDLRKWQILFRGKVVPFEEYEKEYQAGTYRARATYKDWAKEGKWRCPAFVGEVKSDWVEFDVPED